MACLFVEQLTVIDCAHLDAARGLVGESWIVDLELQGDLDAQGMVQDFGLVKRDLKRAVDASVDHRLLVPTRAAGLTLERDAGRTRLLFSAPPDGAVEHASPDVAVCAIDAEAITAASLTEHLLPVLRGVVPGNVADIRLTLREEAIDGAWYRYSHGLRQHDGACQRIAHGHRSRLHIEIDGRRDAELERFQAQAWEDIYLGTRGDLATRANGRLRFAYRAVEGEFELALPEPRCELIDAETTVENLAAHLATRVAAARPGRAVRVRAYEGVNKGAIATV